MRLGSAAVPVVLLVACAVGSCGAAVAQTTGGGQTPLSPSAVPPKPQGLWDISKGFPGPRPKPIKSDPRWASPTAQEHGHPRPTMDFSKAPKVDPPPLPPLPPPPIKPASRG